MKNFLWLTMLGILCAATPLSAQWTGTRLGPKPASAPDGNISKDDIARTTMRSYAHCVINFNRPRVIAYLETIPGSPEAHKISNSLAIDKCLVSDELRFNEKLFRWTVYDDLYNTSYRNFDVTKILTVPETDFASLANAIGSTGSEAIAVWQLGECSVRAAPNEAATLVKSAIGSKIESAAINAIVPHVGGCVDKDSQIKFSKLVLRGIMAEALYKMAKKSDATFSTKGSN